MLCMHQLLPHSVSEGFGIARGKGIIRVCRNGHCGTKCCAQHVWHSEEAAVVDVAAQLCELCYSELKLP